ncbi:MAG: ABC transporter ATP-binding protein, partial [Candidatus Omnitrophica bacterium]|nr:ABC transporter ATP-binding protein [Candidatus Omnitrophota bacterium]
MTEPSGRPRSLKRFLAYVRPHRRYLAGAIAFGVVRYLVPLALPWSIKIVVDDLLPQQGGRSHLQLHLLMAGLCALYGVYALASYWRSYLAGWAGHRVIFDLRLALYRHVQRMSLSFFDRQKIGAVVSRMTTDIASAQNFVGAAFVNTAMDLALLAVIVALLCAMNLTLALVSLSVLPFYAFISYRLQKGIRAKSRAIHHQLQEISGELHEQFAGIATIQAFTQEAAAARQVQAQSEQYFDTVMGNVRLQSLALGSTGFLT